MKDLLPDWAFKGIGFAGQALFTARVLSQWYASEKARRSVVPSSFWWLSVAGTVLLAFYAWSTKDLVFVLGPTANLFLYVRNLYLQRNPDSRLKPAALVVPLTLVLLLSGLLSVYYWGDEKGLLKVEVPPLWLAVGLAGQALWTLRFPVQWVISERLGKSVLPASFWWLSLFGALLLTAYAVYRNDWVFILATAFNPIPCARNLLLIYRGRRKEAE